MNVLIIGAGLTGATLARKFAECGCKVKVVEKRNTPGGMASDEQHIGGSVVSVFGPHIFHTNNEEVWKFITKFGKFIPLDHTVTAWTDLGRLPWPINNDTIKAIYGCETYEEAFEKNEQDIVETAERYSREHDSFEKRAAKACGSKVYNYMVKNYTEKQWRISGKELPGDLFKRVRIEKSTKRNFFNDKYIAIPERGFTSVIANMLAHENIEVVYGTTWSVNSKGAKKDLEWADKAFSTIAPNKTLGSSKELPYLCIKFEKCEDMINLLDNELDSYVINNCTSMYNWTRLTDYDKMYNAQEAGNIYIEIPSRDGEPLYPILLEENIEKYEAFKDKLNDKYDIISCGRLGSYQYLDMDKAIEKAFDLVKQHVCPAIYKAKGEQ